MPNYGMQMSNYGLTGGFGGNNCICSFPTLVILILIVLQFSRCNDRHWDDEDHDHDEKECRQVGNGILFIIALFFLSCAGCGRGNSIY